MISRITKHFKIHYNVGSIADSEIGYIVEQLESSYRKITTDFELKNRFPVIQVFLFDNMAEKVEQTGEDGNAHTDRENYKIFAVYDNDVKPVGAHEVAHLLTNQFGWSNLVLAEGLAESFDDCWYMPDNGQMVAVPHDECVRRFIKKKVFIPITKLYDDHKFWDYDSAVSYPECGSFMKYLRQVYSTELIKSLLKATIRRAEYEKNSEAFKKITGKSLVQAEQDWLQSLSI